MTADKKAAERSYQILAFTDEGMRLAERTVEKLQENGCRKAAADRSGRPLSAAEWTEKYFQEASCLIFIGACGIAVRSIAPLVQNKCIDPAVLVMDECGRYVIPILSGHLGGANRDAERIARLLHLQPVLTTGTDARGKFAVDVWADEQKLQILEPSRIVNVSSAVLNNRDGILVYSVWPVRGARPSGVGVVVRPAGGLKDSDAFLFREKSDVVIDVRVRPYDRGLHLVPKVLVLGIGCRKGISEEAVEKCWRVFSEGYGFPDAALQKAASIDVKSSEQGILGFCSRRRIPFQTFDKDQLNAVKGDFSRSAFVLKTVGTDNVCERSAAAACGGTADCIIAKKFSLYGVTMAAAVKDVQLSWGRSDADEGEEDK